VAGLGTAALVIAGVFAVVVPKKEKVNTAAGWRYIVLRWFHSLVWLFLAAAFFTAGDANLSALASPAAALGGITYLAYIVTFTRLK
jgi:hypothetical protein